MDKTDPPESFGIFKPVGHTLIAFAREADIDAAKTALLAQGFAPQDLVHYTPEEMKALVDGELTSANPLAGFGYELSLVKTHRAMAEEGDSFLIVYAPDDTHAERVDAVLRAVPAVAAYRYGRLVVEELSLAQPG